MEPNTEARSSHGSLCPELVRGDSFMSVAISSTTGSRFELRVPPEETVAGLKRRLSERLRVPGERLMLLHRDTKLSSGKLLDCGVVDGSRLTLVPSVEAGLMSQSWRPEPTVLQALESLTDAQVSDFLSGRSPLTLALRVADHTMFVQLQLAAHQSGTRTRPSDRPRPSPHTNHAHSCQGPTHQTEGCTQRPKCKPGAVIESLVNHAPGIFSGTFSGTLHPNCQDSSGRPRRDISTVLQILSDLLSATRHYQGSTPTLTHLRCQTPSTPPCSTPPSSPPCSTPPCSTPPLTPPCSALPLTPPSTPPCSAPPCSTPPLTPPCLTPPCSAPPCSAPPTPTTERPGLQRRPSGERVRQCENRATRCKVQQLQLLLQQRRVRRRARREPRGPYTFRTRTHSSSSGAAGLERDFQEPVWKAEADRSAEFIAA